MNIEMIFGAVMVVAAYVLGAFMGGARGDCDVCGAPANAQRHATECPWGA